MNIQLRLIAAACLLAAGCNPSEKFVTVEGRVTTLDGKAVNSGFIGFIPDEAAGTMHPEYSLGELQADSRYRLVTNDKQGVRLGKYKVVLWASAEPLSPTPQYDSSGQLKPTRWLVATKYTTKETTDLRVEVVEKPAPGAYDFSVGPP